MASIASLKSRFESARNVITKTMNDFDIDDQITLGYTFGYIDEVLESDEPNTIVLENLVDLVESYTISRPKTIAKKYRK